MLEQTISILHNSNFAIYGAATTGGIFCDRLTQLGLKVRCFIDKRNDEIDEYRGVPVYGINEYSKLDNTGEDIVVIAIKNVFEHEDIANEFVSIGCFRILYKAYQLIKGCPVEHDEILCKVYDDLFGGKSVIGASMPLTYNVNDLMFENMSYVELDNQYVIANIPNAFVFSDKYENKTIVWNSVNIMGLISHLDFFACIKGESKKYDDYLSYCYEAAHRSGGIVTSKRWELSVLENRINVYQNMELERQLNPNFFKDSAPFASLNDKGFFNIHSGKHRMVFQVINGMHFLYLKILKNEYNEWCNISKAKKIYEKLCELKVRKLEVPIMNPYFYKYPCDNMMFYYGMQKTIVEYIYRSYYVKDEPFQFNNMNLYNYGLQGLVINPVLNKMGLTIYTNDCIEDKYMNIAELIYAMYDVQINNMAHVEDFFDIAIINKPTLDMNLNGYKMLFLIVDYEVDMSLEIKYNTYELIASGFCNGKRKKVIACSNTK